MDQLRYLVQYQFLSNPILGAILREMSFHLNQISPVHELKWFVLSVTSKWSCLDQLLYLVVLYRVISGKISGTKLGLTNLIDMGDLTTILE